MNSVIRNSLRAIVACAGLVFANDAAAQQTTGAVPVVSLAEARRRAASTDPSAVAARADLTTASWERRTARSDLFTPSVTAGLGFTRFSEPFFNFGTGAITPNATNATLQVNYTVLGAGKFAELRRANASIESAEAAQEASRFQVALAADAAYFSVLADRELSRVAADRLKRAEEQFGLARVRVIEGEAIASDSLRLLLEVNRARLGTLQRDSALRVSQLRLGRNIGLSGPADAAPADSVAPRALPISEDAAVGELRARGPGTTAARARERRADAVVAAERAGYWPDLLVGATTGTYDSEFFPSALKRTQFAITVSIPIWDGGQRELGIARARMQRDVTRAEREHTERIASEAMSAAYRGYETARASIELTRVGVAVATENFRVQRTRYREGATTSLDLIEAQVGLSEAEADAVQARYAARLALAHIEALLGRRLFEQ
ncbi:MAG TPA: TolC family protein [Gemmatimonadaceae bacterium]|nr:TolC family protein [Gemmatimonadaceae bacterium]